MSHTPNDSYVMTTYCSSLTASGSLNWETLVEEWSKTFLLNGFGNTITANLPYVHIDNQIPSHISMSNDSICLGTGLYEITVEYHSNWDITQTQTLNNLRASTLVRSIGNRGWSEVMPCSIEVYDTGKETSTGYNVIHFKATHYVEIENNGTTDNSFKYGYVASDIAGLNTGPTPLPIYKRNLTITRLTDVIF